MNKYTKQLQAKFDELYEEYADDFCPEELHGRVRETFEDNLYDMAHSGCIFKVSSEEDFSERFKEELCEENWPCIICCICSRIRSHVYNECGLWDEIKKLSQED